MVHMPVTQTAEFLSNSHFRMAVYKRS